MIEINYNNVSFQVEKVKTKVKTMVKRMVKTTAIVAEVERVGIMAATVRSKT